MVITFIRTIILYVAVIFTMRIMGKRQLSQLQPVEFVIAMMISQVAVFPLENRNIPIITSLEPLAILLSLEIFSSVINMKSLKYRTLIQGHSVIIIRNGCIDQKIIKKLRLPVDDILEALRKKDIFDISCVAYALLETDGTVTALLKNEFSPVQKKDLNVSSETDSLPCEVISDGKIIDSEMKECGMNKEKLISALESRRLKVKDVLLMTADSEGKLFIVKKEKK